MKYTAVKRDGKYIFAGFSGPTDLKEGDVVETYDDCQPHIVEEIKANRPKPQTLEGLIAELKAKGVL